MFCPDRVKGNILLASILFLLSFLATGRVRIMEVALAVILLLLDSTDIGPREARQKGQWTRDRPQADLQSIEVVLWKTRQLMR